MDILRVCAQINLGAISRNADAVLKKIPAGVKLLAVVKANAYGHGAVPIANLLKNRASYFGVATVDEGIELRKNGITTPILLLGGIFDSLCETVLRYQLEPAVCSLELAKAYSEAAQKLGVPAPLHLAVDTGMSRIGLPPTKEGADIAKAISLLPNLKINGIFSHFATADEADKTQALAQREIFDRFLFLLKERNLSISLVHLNNSAGIMEFDKQYDMVREGIVLYGLYPSDEVDTGKLAIEPALSLISHISHLRQVSAGQGVSYGRTYITKQPTTIATIPVGYADGYPRNLSNIGRVLIRGISCPILGRICMDQFMVDVSTLQNPGVGEKVTLIGADGEERISVEEIAKKANSFHYELLCSISSRVPRVYING